MGEHIHLSQEKSTQLQRETRLVRWRLQREAQALLPDERVAFCMRHVLASKVDVCYSPRHQSAHYQGLMTCGSVWVCPLCAARISERRRAELEQAIARCIAQGGAVYLATYTVSHHEYDTLSELLDAFLAARRRAKQGHVAQRLRMQFGILGTVSVREVTWSRQNGWHPHCHELVFCEREIDLDEYTQEARRQWQKSAEHEGLSMNEHGFQLDRTCDAVANYVTKFGREPLRNPWSAAAELTKAHMKHGRGEEHLTPFAMLERISQGDEELSSLFLEYARWFKGKHQLVWSPGLRAHLLENSQELSDVEIAQEGVEEAILLGQLDRSQWSVILRKNARGRLLEVARSGDWQQVEAFLQSLGAGGKATSLLLGNTCALFSTPVLPYESDASTNSHEGTENVCELVAGQGEPLPEQLTILVDEQKVMNHGVTSAKMDNESQWDRQRTRSTNIERNQLAGSHIARDGPMHTLSRSGQPGASPASKYLSGGGVGEALLAFQAGISVAIWRCKTGI